MSGKQARRKRRDDAVYMQPQATLFSEDDDLCDPMWLVNEFKKCVAYADELIRETTFDNGGAPRIEGSYALLYLAFTMSGLVDVQKFCRTWRSTGVFALCGFATIPSWTTVRLRFLELEQVEEAATLTGGEGPFGNTRNRLIQLAAFHDEHVGEVVAYDGTQITAHAQLYHMCTDAKTCKAVSDAAGYKPSNRIRISAEELIEDARHAEQEIDGDTADVSPSEVKNTNRIRRVQRGRNTLEFRIHEVGGHEYGCLDLTAGCRAYSNEDGTTKAFWVGALGCRVFDFYLGATLLDFVIPANVQEAGTLPQVMMRTNLALGRLPRSVTADKAMCIPSAYEWCGKNRIELVCPWRQPNWRVTDRTTLSTDLYDYHGEPRCQYCGGAGRRKSVSWTKGGEPRIRFRCQLRTFPDCRTHDQTIACSENWRLIGLLSRRSERYHILRHLHRSTERGHAVSRLRYDTDGKDVGERQKNRRTVSSNQLRANAAGVLEWFRICLRQGFLGSHPKQNTKPAIIVTNDGGNYQRMMRSRELNGVDLPYGSKAIDSGVAWEEPPEGHQPWKERQAAKKREMKAKKAAKRRGKDSKKNTERKPKDGERLLLLTPQGFIDPETGDLVFAAVNAPPGDPPDTGPPTPTA